MNLRGMTIFTMLSLPVHELGIIFPFISFVVVVVVVLCCCFVAKSRLALGAPWTVACQGPLSMGFSRQEYQSGLPFPSSGDLPDPRIEPTSPALQADSLPLSHQGSPFPDLGYYK